MSPNYGPYEYDAILEGLAAAGLVVISESRPRGTDASAYAGRVAGQIERLLGAGVPARRITVVGASVGGFIAMLVSIRDFTMAISAGRCPSGWRRSSVGLASATPDLSPLEGPMPFSLRMEPGSGVVIGTCSGTLKIADAKEGVAAFWATPEWSGRPVVWDFRSAQFDVRATEIDALARFVIENQPPAPPPRVAFVTARDVDFGLARMYEMYREHPATAVRVFRDYDEALSWAMGDGDVLVAPGPGGD